MPVEIDRVASNSQLEYIRKRTGIPIKNLKSFSWDYNDAWKVYNGLMAKPHDPANRDFAYDEIKRKLETEIIEKRITSDEIQILLSNMTHVTLAKHLKPLLYTESKIARSDIDINKSHIHGLRKESEEGVGDYRFCPNCDRRLVKNSITSVLSCPECGFKRDSNSHRPEDDKTDVKVDSAPLDFNYDRPIIRFEMWLKGLSKMRMKTTFQMITGKTFQIQADGPWLRTRIDDTDKIIIHRYQSRDNKGGNRTIPTTPPSTIRRKKLRELFQISESCDDNKKYTIKPYDDSFVGSYLTFVMSIFKSNASFIPFASL